MCGYHQTCYCKCYVCKTPRHKPRKRNPLNFKHNSHLEPIARPNGGTELATIFGSCSEVSHLKRQLFSAKVCCFTTGFNIEDCPMDKKVIIGENAWKHSNSKDKTKIRWSKCPDLKVHMYALRNQVSLNIAFPATADDQTKR